MAHTSVILALFPAERHVRPLRRVARRLPDGGTPASEMHVTLAYLGDVADLTSQRDAVIAALLSFVKADDTRLINLPVAGIQRMPHIDDGEQAIAASIDGDGIRSFRTDLVTALEAQNVPIDERYPEYLPHLTLGYIPATAPTPRLRVPPVIIPAGELCLSWGDEKIILPFLGTQVKAPSAITTKPFTSQSQWRWAWATGQPFARRWANETPGGKRKRFRRLPSRVAKKLRQLATDHDAVQIKAEEHDTAIVWALRTKAGERIAGQLCRDKTGRYVNCNSKGATQESKDKLKKIAREQSQAERDEASAQEQRDNQAKVVAESGLKKNLAESLIDFADPDEPQNLSDANAAELLKAGLVEQNPDGSYRISGAGRSYVTAARSGDLGRARDALGRGADRTARAADRQTRAQERAATRQARLAERERKRAERDAAKKDPKDPKDPKAKPKKGGGGGGKGKEPPKSDGPQAGPARSTAGGSGRSGGSSGGKKPSASATDALIAQVSEIRRERQQRERDSAQVAERLGREERGRAERQARDAARSAAQGKRDAARQQEQGARAAVTSARERAAARREAAALDRLETRAKRGDTLSQAERDQLSEAGRAEETPRGWKLKARRQHTYWRVFRHERKAGRLPSEARLAAKGAVRARDLARLDRRRQRLIGRLTPAVGGLAVYKTRSGQLRWVSFSSNGYLDKDGEHVSVKALAADVARTDQDGRYGPLRWWHEGAPDPMSPDAPWGPGVDLGWCDFSAMSGPCLIESGTFTNDTIGAAIAAKADQYAVSLGFFHPISEPDSGGVFHHIRRFERSLAPKDRVSNPFTSFVVPATKGRPMNTNKRMQLKALLDTLPDDEVDRLIASGVTQTQAAAKAAGVALKTQDAPVAQPVYQLPDGSLGIVENGKIVALKALPVADEEKAAPEAAVAAADAADAAAEAEASAEEAEDEATDDTEYAADLPLEEFKALITEAMRDALAPLVGQLKMTDKMQEMVGKMGEELKGYMSGVGQKADAGQADVAALKAQIAAQERTLSDLQKRLKALDGDTPRAVARASRSVASAVPEIAVAEEATVTTKTGTPAYTSAFDQVGGWLEGQTPAAD